MTQAVKHLLARMQAELPPPTHLRADPKARDLFLQDYERVLSGWPKETLEAAWPLVLSKLDFWIWPRPQQIHDACCQVAAQSRQPGERDQRIEQAVDMADRYVRHYLRHSQVAKLARAEGFIEPLTHFVRASAWVQAQLLCGVQPIGWDTSIARHLGTFTSSAEAFAAYHPTIAGTIRRGRIEIRVPPALLRQWKERSSHEPARAGSP